MAEAEKLTGTLGSLWKVVWLGIDISSRLNGTHAVCRGLNDTHPLLSNPASRPPDLNV